MCCSNWSTTSWEYHIRALVLLPDCRTRSSQNLIKDVYSKLAYSFTGIGNLEGDFEIYLCPHAQPSASPTPNALWSATPLHKKVKDALCQPMGYLYQSRTSCANQIFTTSHGPAKVWSTPRLANPGLTPRVDYASVTRVIMIISQAHMHTACDTVHTHVNTCTL